MYIAYSVRILTQIDFTFNWQRKKVNLILPLSNFPYIYIWYVCAYRFFPAIRHTSSTSHVDTVYTRIGGNNKSPRLRRSGRSITAIRHTIIRVSFRRAHAQMIMFHHIPRTKRTCATLPVYTRNVRNSERTLRAPIRR